MLSLFLLLVLSTKGIIVLSTTRPYDNEPWWWSPPLNNSQKGRRRRRRTGRGAIFGGIWFDSIGKRRRRRRRQAVTYFQFLEIKEKLVLGSPPCCFLMTQRGANECPRPRRKTTSFPPFFLTFRELFRPPTDFCFFLFPRATRDDMNQTISDAPCPCPAACRQVHCACCCCSSTAAAPVSHFS